MFTLTLKRKQSLRTLVAQFGGTVDFSDPTAVQIDAPEGFQWETGLSTFCHPVDAYDTFVELFDDVKSRLTEPTKIKTYIQVQFFDGDQGYYMAESLDFFGADVFLEKLAAKGYLDQPLNELEARSKPLWGTNDRVHYIDVDKSLTYAISSNLSLGYVAVTAII